MVQTIRYAKIRCIRRTEINKRNRFFPIRKDLTFEYQGREGGMAVVMRNDVK